MTPLEVHTLLGHRQVDLSIKCLSSLVRTSVEKVAFVLHEDGSLTADDILRLKDNLPVASVISRKESDERVLPLMKDYKYIYEYRSNELIGIKLFDIPLLSGPEIYYIDTDILFMAPHRGLFSQALTHGDSVFAPDVFNMYSLLPWQIKPFSSIGLQSRVNSGAFAFRQSAYSLEFLDRFFATFDSSPFFKKRRFHTEQTSWSALCTQSKAYTYDATQLTIGFPGFPYDPQETLAIHFVSQCRDLLPEYDHRQRENDAPKDFRFHKSPTLTPPGYFMEMSTRIAKTRLKALLGKSEKPTHG